MQQANQLLTFGVSRGLGTVPQGGSHIMSGKRLIINSAGLAGGY
ncbi:hypothetical protein COO91_06265 [Nostoc flagelliforme CCNUN1]|uniref:Uncharacterized protein n=1 Tax=Nostoc flagelliforme CCNUN1 TaxID=2038116 RepID=A0A2K8SXT1_9NOSO|nr:hypothetical protein COO91_06265 [Nostoc flagelliforme CCNUN1]